MNRDFGKLILLVALALPGAASAPSLYDYKVNTLEGKPEPLSRYKGKVVLVVNVASKCGFTPQYEGLEKLYKQYHDQGLVILGFPSNDFGGQEPGTAAEIQTFCRSKYSVTFPMFEKVSTKPGPTQAPVYHFLTAGREAPSWNFCKYLVDRQGHVVKFYASAVKPDSEELKQALQAQLASK